MDIDGGTTGFESLPRDVQLRVVESLPAKDAVAFAGVNSACLSVYREVAGLGQFLKAIPREILLENVLPRLDDEVDRVMFSRVNKSCRLAIQEAGLTPRHCTMPLTSSSPNYRECEGGVAGRGHRLEGVQGLGRPDDARRPGAVRPSS